MWLALFLLLWFVCGLAMFVNIFTNKWVREGFIDGIEDFGSDGQLLFFYTVGMILCPYLVIPIGFLVVFAIFLFKKLHKLLLVVNEFAEKLEK
jgi:hypothetical protein